MCCNTGHHDYSARFNLQSDVKACIRPPNRFHPGLMISFSWRPTCEYCRGGCALHPRAQFVQVQVVPQAVLASRVDRQAESRIQPRGMCPQEGQGHICRASDRGLRRACQTDTCVVSSLRSARGRVGI